MRPRDYLKKGKQTDLMPEVLEEARKVRGEGLHFVINALRHIHSSYRQVRQGEKDVPPKRIRTAGQLVESRVLNGCTDYAHLFIVLCRARGIPAAYVETFHEKWLAKPTAMIFGHIFVKVYVDEEWLVVDPMRGNISAVHKYNPYKPMRIGLDFRTLFPTDEDYYKTIKKEHGIDIRKIRQDSRKARFK